MEAFTRLMVRPGPVDLAQMLRLDVYDKERDALTTRTWSFCAHEGVYIPFRGAAVAAVAAAPAAPAAAGPARPGDGLHSEAELKAVRTAAAYLPGPALT
ncbi:hypothetical protein FVE85_4203 [Porphyridium purpureum]|uniref:Uncharacterized protein n=1 Tax=Porphyridium purpureum TaxID=35688 RepID=A0A5J4YSH0_PORPP|nr:hypothetical protein FVE85_4203 [Porphyridium purpureum]|eukprot:POR9261..scf229_5